MKKPRNTRRISVISKRSWVASAILLLAVCLCCCSPSGKSEGGSSIGTKATEVDRLKNSWVGLYAQRNEKIARLLSDGEGWVNFREMALPAAITAFSSGTSIPERIGKARACLQLAETFAVLDGFYLKTEAEYLGSPAVKGIPGAAGRLGFIRLRQGDTDAAGKIFSAAPPRGQEAVWSLGRAGVEVISGKSSGGAALEKAVKEAPADKTSLALTASYSWGRPAGIKDKSQYSSAVSSLAGGDFGAAAGALERAGYGSAEEAGPDLFLYDLLRITYAKYALASLKTVGGQEAAWLSGRALWLLKDYEASVSALAGVTGEQSGTLHPALLFGVIIDGQEMLEVSTALRGASLIRAGKTAEGTAVLKELLDGDPGAFTLAYLAELQVGMGIKGPLGNPEQAVNDSITAIRMDRIKMLEVENGEIASAILGARQAEICRKASSVVRAGGKSREALDLLDSAHQKRKGYKPDFINPPAFLLDLASAYAQTGQYAPSTEILFELSNQYPAVRLGYESLKRLYASRTGGEAPPR
ncbi:hypothetical protein EPN96_07065 [bacterium]|nr:MAG: hypothetical protein EPN96_07065 [bacterium]